MVASSIVTSRVVSVLKTVPHLQFLPVHELKELAASMSLEYFLRDTVILMAGSKASASLYVVRKGGVKLTLPSEGGEEILFDVRSEGEIFGRLSIFKGDVARLHVTSVDDQVLGQEARESRAFTGSRGGRRFLPLKLVPVQRYAYNLAS